MATEVLAVTSTDTNWNFSGGANRTASVAAPDDDATSYIWVTDTFSPTATGFSVANTALTGADTINSVTVKFRGRYTAGDGPMSNTYHDGTSGYVDSSINFLSSWTTDSYTMLTKPSGGAWTVAALNALTLSIQDSVGENITIEISTITVEVDYTAGASATLHLVPMTGSGLL